MAVPNYGRWAQLVTFVGLAGAGVSVLAVPAFEGAAQSDRYARVLEFIDRAYPGLRSATVGVQISSGESLASGRDWMWDFSVLLTQANAVSATRSPDESWFVAHLAFHNDTPPHFSSFHAYGRFVRQPENERLVQAVRDDVDWSEARVRASLDQHGVKYGPDKKAELLAVADLDALRLFVNGEQRLRIAEASFTFPPPSKASDWKSGELLWRVTYVTTAGRKVRYYASFEPFDGKLVDLLRSYD